MAKFHIGDRVKVKKSNIWVEINNNDEYQYGTIKCLCKDIGISFDNYRDPVESPCGWHIPRKYVIQTGNPITLDLLEALEC